MEKLKDGNTVSHPSTKRDNQLYKWCFTYNNYLEEEILPFRLLLNRICKSYCFQEETGVSGNKHLQGTLSLKVKARLTELKKINKKIHWESTRNEERAKLYCCKEETRTGKIYKLEKQVLFHRKSSKFDNLIPREEILDIVKEEPDNRTINWVWSKEGRLGKTSTASYLEHNYEGVLVCNGKGNDIKNTIINFLEHNSLECLIVNMPRQAEGYINYGVLEEIKDGLIYSGKYEGGFANIEHPHVLVMCNFEPDYSMMSRDRWHVIELE